MYVTYAIHFFSRRKAVMLKKTIFCLLISVFVPVLAFADAAVVSKSYVDTTKVDVSANTNQTMAGKYTVTGEFHVPTPELPTAQ